MNLLHISDFDDTIIPSKVEEEIKNQYAKHYQEFISNNHEFSIIYSSGRFCDSILEQIERLKLPKPLYIIGGVGIEIFNYQNQEYVKEWEDFIKTSKFYNVAIKQLLFDNFGITAREKSGKYKVYYHIFDLTDDDLQKMETLLIKNGFDASLIYSRNKILDIVPKIANKGNALKYLINKEKIDEKNIAVSGDSLNDIDMFFEDFGINITPKNAEIGLLKKLEKHKNHFHSKESFSKGVTDGLNQFIKRFIK